MIYLEPVPYVLGLIDRLRASWQGKIDVFFVGKDLTQAWDLPLERTDFGLLPQRWWAAMRFIWRLLQSNNCCLLHLAGWGHSLLLTSSLFARLRAIPLSVESDTPLPPTALPLRVRLKRLLHPLLFKVPAVFLPGGRRQAQYLRHYGVPDSRMHVAQMTVDVSAISRHVKAIGKPERMRLRTRFHLNSNSVVFLYVGRLEAHKGIDDLLHAFNMLHHARQNVELLIVGDGSERGKISMNTHANARIHATGRLQGKDLLDAYSVTDVLVLPSHFEPWGLVVNEAMAAGLPVIVSNRLGCIDDLVESGKTGLIVPAENPHALYKAMENLSLDCLLRRRMAEGARQRIAGWTLENEAANVINAWKEVLNL